MSNTQLLSVVYLRAAGKVHVVPYTRRYGLRLRADVGRTHLISTRDCTSSAFYVPCRAFNDVSFTFSTHGLRALSSAPKSLTVSRIVYAVRAAYSIDQMQLFVNGSAYNIDSVAPKYNFNHTRAVSPRDKVSTCLGIALTTAAAALGEPSPRRPLIPRRDK